MTNLIEETRRLTEEGKLAEADRKACEQKEAAALLEKQKLADVTWAAAKITDCHDAIRKAAAAGRNTVGFDIATFENEYSDRTRRRSKALTELLIKDGFTVKENIDATEPVGSDPMFYNTVYSTDLRISW
jgi:hypothetical protein